MNRVLVFDSGVGGLSVLDAIVRAGVAVELDYCADTAWLPYGGKPDADVAARVPVLLQSVAAQWESDLIVIACNTAS
ncbi:MAG: glutamate racemase, partial [Hyphomonadaceae bacterium]